MDGGEEEDPLLPYGEGLRQDWAFAGSPDFQFTKPVFLSPFIRNDQVVH